MSTISEIKAFPDDNVIRTKAGITAISPPNQKVIRTSACIWNHSLPNQSVIGTKAGIAVPISSNH